MFISRFQLSICAVFLAIFCHRVACSDNEGYYGELLDDDLFAKPLPMTKKKTKREATSIEQQFYNADFPYYSFQLQSEQAYVGGVLQRDSLDVAQILLEACLRDNVYYQEWKAPCKSSWLVFTAMKVLKGTAYTILRSFSRLQFAQPKYIDGWVPSHGLLKALAEFNSPIFEEYCVYNDISGTRHLNDMYKMMAECLGQHNAGIRMATISLAMWTLSLTNAWPALKRPREIPDNPYIIPIIYNYVEGTLSCPRFDQHYDAILYERRHENFSETEQKSAYVFHDFSDRNGESESEEDERPRKRRKRTKNTETNTVPKQYYLLKRLYKVSSGVESTSAQASREILTCIKRDIEQHLAPLAEANLLSATPILQPINHIFKIDLDRLQALKKLPEIPGGEKRCHPWVGLVEEVFSGTRHDENTIVDNLRRFSLWYASLIALALGPNGKIAFDEKQLSVDVSC